MLNAEVNSYSAGSIIDLMPDGMYETLCSNVLIRTNNPSGERLQEFHGGIEFDITINGRTLHWIITHNYNDFFDLELHPEGESVLGSQKETDLGNGDLKNVFDTLWEDYIKHIQNAKDVLTNIIHAVDEEE